MATFHGRDFFLSEFINHHSSIIILIQTPPPGESGAADVAQPVLGQEAGLDGQVAPTMLRDGVDVEAGADQERLADPRDGEVLPDIALAARSIVVPNEETHFGLIQ